MTEFFIDARTFAMPYVSETIQKYVDGVDALAAMEAFIAAHEGRIFAADLYHSADDYHKQGKPVARWLCNKEIARAKATEGKASYTYLSLTQRSFEVDGERFFVDDPTGGRLVDV